MTRRIRLLLLFVVTFYWLPFDQPLAFAFPGEAPVVQPAVQPDIVSADADNASSPQPPATLKVRQRPMRILTRGVYHLPEDFAYDGTAVEILASNVVLDLKGHTVWYGKDLDWRPPSPRWTFLNHAFGIVISSYGLSDVTIKNGRLIELTPRTELQPNGIGHNPIFANGCNNLTLENLHVEYAGADVTGFWLKNCSGAKVLDCVVHDRGTEISDRHQGLDAIRLYNNSLASGNQILRCRHRGILAADGCTITGNRISVDSWAVNGGGVLCFRTKGVRVTDNVIEGTGYHCTGVAATSEGCQDIHVADNKITMRGNGPLPRVAGAEPLSTLAGFRVTRYNGEAGEIRGVTFVGNTVAIEAEGGGVARGAWICTDSGTRDVTVKNNHVTVLADKNVEAATCSVAGNYTIAPERHIPILFEGNTWKTNSVHVRFGEPYGVGCNTRFQEDRFIRVPSSHYTTIVAGFWDKPTTLHQFQKCITEDGANLLDVVWKGTGLASYSVDGQLVQRPPTQQ